MKRANLTPTLALLAGLLACGPSEDGAGGEEDRAPAVEAVPARAGTLPLEERLNGVVRADNQITVQPEIEAPVVEVMGRNGEAVKRGQPLVRLADDELRDQLRQAEADVRLAEATAREARARVAEIEAQVTRTRRLAEEEVVSALELETREAQLAAAQASADQARARVDQARAVVQERRSALDKTLIRAPVAGHIGQRNAEVGMLATPSDVLFVLGDLDDLVVEVPLTGQMLGHIRVGQPVSISSPALRGTAVAGTLARISPFLEEGSFSTVGEIDVANQQGRLSPGMFVTVDILYGQSERATLVPASALWEDPRTGVQGVFVVDGTGLAEAAATTTSDVPETPRGVRFQPVEVLAEGRATAGVTGVREGQWVVVVGQQLLARDGEATARVRPTTWDRVLGLQGLQREDLLQSFLDKQQRWAREHGAQPPGNEEFLGQGGGAGPGAGGS
jgi:RND family efflux transporter MFP subunit